MTNKKTKKISIIKILLAVSLLVNFVFINQTLDYEKFIKENISRSILDIESDLIDVQEVLNQIVQTGEINEWEYRRIYFTFDSFENEFKSTLYRYYYELESKNKDFSDINLVFDMNDYLFLFGKEKKLSLLKNKDDSLNTIDLKESELEQFKHIINKTNDFLKVFDSYKIDRDTRTIRNWTKTVERIYDVGLNE